MHEYGIVTDTEPHILHRGPMSQDEADEWMNDLLPQHQAMFRVVWREVTPWKIVES